jgi:alpha-L-rhamnosidase
MTTTSGSGGLIRRDWQAQMIAPLADQGQGTPASFVARDFTLDKVAGDEVLFASAQGLYIAFINGTRVGHDLLTPGWTCYDDRIAYQSYPVGSLLRPGANRIEIWLADGWFRSQMMWAMAPIVNCWGDKIAAIAEIVTGGKTILATDATWKSGGLPLTRSGIYYGESQDARITPAETAGTEVVAFDTALLVAHETAPVVEMEPLTPVDQWTDDQGRVTYDFGQNVGGYVRLTVQGTAGATVLVEHSEVMAPGRTWDNRNYRSARGAADYILKGGEPETLAPLFSFMGYRFARVTITGEAKVTAIASVPISSVPDQTGTFTSGSTLVNRLVMNTVWSQRANFIEVPTDCPQRDERLGWTGDAQVFAGTACWLADSHRFLRKYLRDVMADQRPDGGIPHFAPDPTRLHPSGNSVNAGSTGWGDAITIIPWQLYLHYGDEDVLRECFPAMLKWLDYLWSISDGPVILPHSSWGKKGFTFGDWLQPIGDNRKPRPTIGDDCAATLYHYISASTAARIAGVLGETAEKARLDAKAATIKAAFAHEFITASGRLGYNDQTSYAIAFLYDLIPPEHDAAARAQFRRIIEDANYLIGTGFIGTPALLPALTKLGMTDLAAKVFLQTEVPGWMYQVKQGATTIWERWDALGPEGQIYDPEMNSYNHYAYGAVCQWLFESVAGIGIDPGHPGFARVALDPVIIPELSPVAATHDTGFGRITAGWTLEGSEVRYTVNIPDGMTAEMAARPGLMANGMPQSGKVTLGAGKHSITFAHQ